MSIRCKFCSKMVEAYYVQEREDDKKVYYAVRCPDCDSVIQKFEIKKEDDNTDNKKTSKRW